MIFVWVLSFFRYTCQEGVSEVKTTCCRIHRTCYRELRALHHSSPPYWPLDPDGWYIFIINTVPLSTFYISSIITLPTQFFWRPLPFLTLGLIAYSHQDLVFLNCKNDTSLAQILSLPIIYKLLYNQNISLKHTYNKK